MSVALPKQAKCIQGTGHSLTFCVFPKVEGGWNRSASFPVDSFGEYTLRLTRRVDVSKLKHIPTRRSAEFDVTIPKMEVTWDECWCKLFLLALVQDYHRKTLLLHHGDNLRVFHLVNDLI